MENSSEISESFPNKANAVETRTNLIINYLPAQMTGKEVYELFVAIGQISSCKLIMKPNSPDKSMGYAFVEYASPEHAVKAVKLLNGIYLHNKKIKVSFAKPNASDFIWSSLYVSGLPKDMNLEDLNQIFGIHGKILSSRIIYENSDCIPPQYQDEGNRGMSKGIAFVYYNLACEAYNAITALNGKVLEGSFLPLHIQFVKNQYNSTGNRINYNPYFTPSPPRPLMHFFVIFVYNLHPDCAKADLWTLFGPFGAVLKASIVEDANKKSRRYGFVTMKNYYEALRAIHTLNGYYFQNNILQVRFKSDRRRRL